VLAFEQSKNENLLADARIKAGKPVLWNTEFTQLRKHTDHIVVDTLGNGGRQSIQAKYLIACDGANSGVRQQLQFRFDGGTYAQRFFVADTRLEWKLRYDQVIIAPGDHNFCGFLPLHGEDGYRVLGILPEKYRLSEQVTFEDIEQVIRKTIAVPLRFRTVNWFSVYKLHHRCVDHFREGRVFLAGDSAHIHSPAGGQGMNTGLQDAYNLCWKLAMVLNNQAKASLLDTYNEERLPFARWLLQFTDRGFNLMTNENGVIKVLRKYIGLRVMGIVLANKWIRPRAFRILSQLWYSYKGNSLSLTHTKQSLSFRAGDRFPYMETENVHLLLKGAAFHLVHVGGTLPEKENVRLSALFSFQTKLVPCPITAEWKTLGVTKELYILVRPDNYIAMISDVMDKRTAVEYLKQHFHTPMV
jgi:2-polyprenyl-6-methoxyphenol hydroxylase-like FAD-dependent oxidoreductase